MNWINFAIWLFGIYTAYYSALLAWDFRAGKRSLGDDETGELTFVKDGETVKNVPDEPSGNIRASPVVSSGGTSLKQTFNLAREDAIDYIRAVSF
ncbi:hypothetical protein [Mucilaginibacter sp. PAMB04168]|uniref:hypothetical protein n=1 Tax=Mucilaginibacter sp. PAMB04168 TaxID=3138567 RepID=UPI0031F62DBC